MVSPQEIYTKSATKSVAIKTVDQSHRHLFKSAKEKTFANEESLPSLPVPTLRPTLDCYLDSVRAIAGDQQYETSAEMCRRFEAGVGQTLQHMFEKRTQNSKNW
ncbi:unnamed protein product, partial [Medioppia subpectinata]